MFVVSPFINFNSEYDSNFFRINGASETTALVFKLLPGIKISNKNNRQTDLRLSANGSYSYFTELTDYMADTDDRNKWDLSASADMVFFKDGRFSFSLTDQFTRNSFTNYNTPLNKINNTLKVGFSTIPWGRGLKIDGGYRFIYNKTTGIDELTAGAQVAAEAQDNMEHNFSLGVEWRFLPKTSFIFSGDFGLITHPNENTQITYSNADAYRAGFRTGLVGVITPKLAIRLIVGWDFINYDSGSDFNSVVGAVEATYAFTRKSNLVVGYERSVQDAITASYVDQHSLYLNFMSNLQFIEYGINNSIKFDIYNGEMDFQAALGGNGVTISGSQNGVIANISPFITYKYKKQLKISLQYDLNKRFTDYTAKGIDSTVTYDYLQHKVTLGCTYFF